MNIHDSLWSSRTICETLGTIEVLLSAIGVKTFKIGVFIGDKGVDHVENYLSWGKYGFLENL